MFKKYHIILMAFFSFIDISLAPVSLYLAGGFNRDFSFSFQKANSGLYQHAELYIASIVIWAIFFRVFPLYNSKRATRLYNEILSVSAAAIAAWFAFTGYLFAFGYTDFSRFSLFAFAIINILLLAAFHLALRLLLRYLRSRGYNLKKVLIIGAGPVGEQLARTLLERPWTGFSIVGFLDDDPSLQGTTIFSFPILGTLDDVHAVVETMQGDDEIIIALPTTANERLLEVIRMVEDLPINVRVIPDFFGVAYIQPDIEEFWGIPMVGIRKSEIPLSSALTKRLFDLVGSLIALVLASPIMLVTAILIKFDSKGPVLFLQKRVGENGRTFTIYKFRTMVEGSEEMLGDLISIDQLEEPVFKLKNDPRVTRLGRFLRKSSIDELPQLINVLMGDMSLVGPRPEEVQMVSRYNSWQRKRLMMKPGLTGPVQVNGRGDLSLSNRVQLETEYIRNYSLLKDIKILVKTIPVVLKGNGSY